MWVDVFPKNGNIPEIVDVTPPIAEHYELRVIILSVVDVKLVDNNFFTGEHSDILIQGLVVMFKELLLSFTSNYLTIVFVSSI